MRHISTLAVLPCLLLPLACKQVREHVLPATPPEEVGLWEDAAGDVEDPELATAVTAVWESSLAAHPVRATYLGDPRYHGKLASEAPAAVDRRVAELDDLLFRMSSIDPARLNHEDRVTRDLVVEDLERERSILRMDAPSWSVDPLGGPQNEFLSLAADQPVDTARERAQLVERWGRMAGAIREKTDNLRRGLRFGRVASKTAVTKVIAELDEILETDPMDSPLVAPATGGGTWLPLEPDRTLASLAYEHLGDANEAARLQEINRHLIEGPTRVAKTRVLLPAADDPLSAAERGRFLNDVLVTVRDEIYPAIAEYRRTLSQRILPAARSDAQPGLVWLDGGEDWYRTWIRVHLSLPLSPEEIHQFGLEEVARTRAEMIELGREVFGTETLSELQDRLRNDPELHFASRDEVQAKATEAVFRANRALPQVFGLLPASACEVVRVPAHEEQAGTIAYYREPAPDGSRPGRYYVNTSDPETRPRYDAEVLAFHESIPGHHLQIAVAQELEGLPLVRRHGGSTAFVEGWGLYTERLADEMGLYSSDLDRLGMLSFDAWRACRLVVDTGIHAKGWSRERAIAYLMENTLLARNNVENEVDRYIAWPGQALAYKIGQQEILSLRAEAREALGPRFSLREFHDHVLGNGPVTLSVLRDEIGRWLGRE